MFGFSKCYFLLQPVIFWVVAVLLVVGLVVATMPAYLVPWAAGWAYGRRRRPVPPQREDQVQPDVVPAVADAAAAVEGPVVPQVGTPPVVQLFLLPGDWRASTEGGTVVLTGRTQFLTPSAPLDLPPPLPLRTPYTTPATSSASSQTSQESLVPTMSPLALDWRQGMRQPGLPVSSYKSFCLQIVYFSLLEA
jgi:hypothetical protein